MVNLDKRTLLQLGNIIAVVLTVIINTLAVVIPLGGLGTGEISDLIPNLFVPSGITFSIWSVIYVLLFLFAFYQAKDLFKKDKEDLPFLDQISYLFIIASAANILWIFLWQYLGLTATYLSLIAMLPLLFTLILIYLRLDIGRAEVTRNVKLMIHLPISVYLGWITVATIANVTSVLVTAGWDRFGLSESLWTILVLVVATVITLLVILKRKDIGYSLVIIWALSGIIIKRLDPLQIPHIEIVITAAIAIGIIVVAILWSLLQNKQKG
jgi:hypothetical protein